MILLLGGTGEARQLSHLIREDTALRALPLRVSQKTGQARLGLRVGGFGGVAGLVDWCQQHGVRILVDATHPFSRPMQAHAQAAAEALALLYLRLERQDWQLPDALRYRSFASERAMATALSKLPPQRLAATLGAKALSWLARLSQHEIWVRVIDPETMPALPPHIHLVKGRGPFGEAEEAAWLAAIAPDLLLSKRSGGKATAAKVSVAAQRGLPVWLLERPACTAPLSQCYRSALALVEALKDHI